MRSFLTGLAIVATISAFAQPKQGPVTKNYEGTNQPRYKGQFKDDKPVGTFTYFLRNGEKSAEVVHQGNGVSYAKNFHANGKVSSEGKYINQKKDSVWTFYKEDGALLSREGYKSDLKEGKSLVYMPNGVPALEQNYTNGKLNGKVFTYLESGKVRTEDNFVNDIINGPSIIYADNGQLLKEGNYLNGKRNGIWKEFNTDGTIHATVEFKNDVEGKQVRLNGEFMEYYDNELPKALYTYKDGRLNGPFFEYQEGGSWETVEKEDPRSGDKDTYRVPKNHFLKRKGSYVNDKLSGKIQLYGPQGALEKAENYTNGVKQP